MNTTTKTKSTNLGEAIWLAAVLVICMDAESVRSQLTVNDKLLRTIEKYMDTSKDPCDDFFSYACGKWSKEHTSGRYTESTGLVDHKINKRLVGLLQSYNYGQDSIMDKVWTFYKSCRHERRHRIIPYIRLVKPGNGLNWPIFVQRSSTKKWNEEKFDWLKTLGRLHQYGLKDTLIHHVVIQNASDSSQYIMVLDKPDEGDMSQLLVVVSEMFASLGFDNTSFTFWLKRLKLFEETLQLLLENESEYSPSTLTIRELETLMPSTSWKEYFQIMLGHEISDDYAIQMENYQYFKNLEDFLSFIDPKLICNYLMWKFLTYLSLDMSSSGDKIDCMVDVRSKMDLATNFIYAQRYYKTEANTYNEDVKEILEVIRYNLRSKLEENRMNLYADELEFLQRKLDSMRVNMGNVPEHLDQEFVFEYYENIELDRKNYHRNHLSLLKLRFQREHEQLFKGQPKSSEFFFIADSDTARSSTPFYIIRKNLIVIPYGFLQTPIYHHNMHDVYKYSLLGFNLAHEIAHGFDASGVIYDYEGVFSEVGANITENFNFTNTISCMQRNETPNLDERIADIVGLRLSYDSFFKNNRSRGERNSTYNGRSAEEVFFLNFAQFFCGNTQSSEFIDHDSDDVRLKEALSNFEPFTETYRCKVGSAMSAKQKCRLW